MKDAILLAGLPVVGGLLGAAITSAFGWATEKSKASAPAAIAASQTAFQVALNDQATAFIKALQSDRSELENEVAALRAALDAQGRELAALREDHSTCLGENRQLNQRIDSLEAELRRRGVDLPRGAKVTGFVELSDGKATVLQPTLQPPPRPRRRRRERKEST